MADTPEEPKGPSKRALEKEAKKAAAKAKKDAAKASNANDSSSKPAANAASTTTPAPVDQFKTGWLKGVYNEKPVEVVQTRFPPEPYVSTPPRKSSRSPSALLELGGLETACTDISC